ncbi:hypothetical protein BH18ACT1_BH18ACT1_13230 [soil metagenome]
MRVVLVGPLDIPRSLEGLRRPGDDLLDRWDGEVLLRTLPTPGGPVPVAARSVGTLDAPALEVVAGARAAGSGDAVDDPALLSALAATFVPTPPSWPALLASDPVLARLDEEHLGVRPVLHPDVLRALVRSVTAQQVNLTFATVLRRRLAEAYADEHVVDGRVVRSFDAARLAGAEVADLRALQFSVAKARAVIGLAGAVAAGELVLGELDALPDDEVILRLVAYRGIGRWTADWFLARVLGRAAVAAGDLAVRKAVGRAYLGGRMPSEEEVRVVTAHWGESAGVAQQVLLDALFGPAAAEGVPAVECGVPAPPSTAER